MRCAMRNCNKIKHVNPVTSLCPSCEKIVNTSQSDRVRQDNQSRQNQARSSALDQQRNLNVSLSPASSAGSGTASTAPPTNNQINFPYISTPNSSANLAPPVMNLASLQNTYSEMVARNGTGGAQDQILTDMYGMLLNVLSKQTENDAIKQEVQDHSYRIRELEAKVGDPSQISEKLGLAVRNLPLPTPGLSELDNVRAAFSEIKAPGIEVERDIVKAVRVGFKEDYLGTVKVEMLNDASRASIMKNKKSLGNHLNPTMKNLIVKNLKTDDQMRMENFARDVLQMVPGGHEYYVAGNGHLRQKDFKQNQHHYQPRSATPRFTQAHQHPSQQHPRVVQPGGLQGGHKYVASHPRPDQIASQHGQIQQPPISLSFPSNIYSSRQPPPVLRAGDQQSGPHQFQHRAQPNPYSPNQITQVYHGEMATMVSRQPVHAPNPLDSLDPFQSSAALQPPVTADSVPSQGGAILNQPGGAQDEILPNRQAYGHEGEQVTVHDRIVNRGQ